MAMRISIITPSFNQAQYLEQTIDSVLSQNHPNCEYIIIDGGSTDGSIEIIKKHEKHLAHWESAKDRGQSHAINKGLSRASGEVVNWLNSDDYYQPDSIKIVGDYFADPATNVLCARSNIVKNQKTIRQSTGTDVYQNNLTKTIGWARIDQPETFFRRSAYEKVGLLNENLHYVMDREWWMRYLFLFGLEGIRKVDDVLVNFRLHDQSKTESKQIDFEREGNLLFLGLANQAGSQEIISFMGNMLNVGQINYNQQFPIVNMELAKHAIQYFLLYKADQEYYRLNFKVAQQFLHQIDGRCFTSEDKKLWDKLSFRLKYWPAPIVKLIRQWK